MKVKATKNGNVQFTVDPHMATILHLFIGESTTVDFEKITGIKGPEAAIADGKLYKFYEVLDHHLHGW